MCRLLTSSECRVWDMCRLRAIVRVRFDTQSVQLCERTIEGCIQVRVGWAKDVVRGRERVLARLPPAVQLLDGLQERGKVLVRQPRTRPAPPAQHKLSGPCMADFNAKGEHVNTSQHKCQASDVHATHVLAARACAA